MKHLFHLFATAAMTLMAINMASAQDTNAVVSNHRYMIYQFPKGKEPKIDGNTDDWRCVGRAYEVTEQFMKEDEKKHAKPDTATLKFTMRVGWSAATQRLYFLYEAEDDYWRFSENTLSTDILEVVVDGDCSGGPFIQRFHPTAANDVQTAWFNFQGVQAQNYHIFTPPHGDDWCMYWGPQIWLKQKPYADHAYRYAFKEGERGKLVLEFYITPYDRALADSPEKSVPTVLREGNDVGLCWAVIDWDSNPTSKDGFWNLSRTHTMYGNADYLPKFQLMPIER